MKRRKDDSGYGENGRRTETPRTVLILGGKNVMSLLYTPRNSSFLNVICTHSSGEELKAKAPARRKMIKLIWSNFQVVGLGHGHSLMTENLKNKRKM